MLYVATVAPPTGFPTGGADPHFLCPLRNHEKLCFSVMGIPEFVFNLFSDVNLQLNAKFALPHADESRHILESATFIQQLGLIVKHPMKGALIKVKISALDHSIVVADSLIFVKQYPVTVNIVNNTVTTAVETVSSNPAHDETAWVKIITDVGFNLKLKFVKKHLDYAITDSSGLTSKAHGIQGIYARDIHVYLTMVTSTLKFMYVCMCKYICMKQQTLMISCILSMVKRTIFLLNSSCITANAYIIM